MAIVNDKDRKRPYRTRIHWTEEETKAFMQEAKKYGAPEQGDTEEVFRKAMEAIPAERRRPFNSELGGRMNRERRKGGVYNGFMSTPSPEPAQVTVPPTQTVEEPIVEPPAPLPSSSNILGSLASQLSAALADVVLSVLHEPRIRHSVREFIREMTTPENELTQINAMTWREPKVPKDRPPRIVIAGGTKGIQQTLEGIKNVDLRFWGWMRHENIHRLKGLLTNADSAVVITTNISHSATDAISDWRKRENKHVIYWQHSYPDLKIEIERVLPEIKKQLNGDNQ